MVSQSPEENEIPTIRVEATSPGRNANAFREAAQGYTGGPPHRAPVPHPVARALAVNRAPRIASELHTAPLGSRKNRLRARRDHPGLADVACPVVRADGEREGSALDQKVRQRIKALSF